PPTSPPDAAGAWQEIAADPWQQLPHRNRRLVQLVRERFPNVQVRDLAPLLFEARWAKTLREREYMRRSGRIGALGVAEAIRSTRPDYFEWEVAAAARFVYFALGQQEDAFAPILASGPNVNIIHYTELDRRLRGADLVMLDYGSDYGYYTSDVTRTWAASGSFTPEQLEYYRTVALIRDSVVAAIRPGVTVRQLLEIAQRVTRARGHEDVAWTTRTGYIGHFVGMAVHDPGPNERPFVAGVVFNVEPIIDLPERHWHFRLEDTVLVTETGHEVLTDAAPVAPEALERLYAETGVLERWKERPPR
ncbi:MAG: aminopeptidase P family protein, partial [Gemmatimonadetes bacterium]|nr:aminopeptidase P family protein [Gemmatimonadota bacterium]